MIKFLNKLLVKLMNVPTSLLEGGLGRRLHGQPDADCSLDHDLTIEKQLPSTEQHTGHVEI